ncbi:hypothetical protein [Treponema maltophilum]|mgnify:CR=1 FL=1|uniref:Lipoprotein n=1 Tax=Treponema maltophilum ATCC 51939 TaxID=1125699 RepID=S3KG15_TREMA|nr:hypothetical protein [Treponema maltophilum]EPF31162.1 hypothetical protein HMPREF9194_01503 [Treponema maltophilum ATCC 51939]
MKRVLLLSALILMTIFSSCKFEPKKEGWEKFEPEVLYSISFKGPFTSDHKMSYYKNKTDLIRAYNACVIDTFDNIEKNWNVNSKLKFLTYSSSFITCSEPNSTHDKVETVTVEEVKQKLKNYKSSYDNSCFAFIGFFYGATKIGIYYIENDELKYCWYDSFKHGK